MAREWGERIGYLTPRHYYQAIFDALRARLVERDQPVSQQRRVKSFVTDVGCDEARTFEALVVAANPHALLRGYVPPIYIVHFDMAVVPSLEGYNRFDIEYRRVVDGKIETKYRGGQFQVDVMISSIAETRSEAYCMLWHLFRHLPQPYGILWVRDSLGIRRPFSYSLTSIDDISEINSLYERYVGFNVTFTLFCQIDYWAKVSREDILPIDEVIINFNP